MKLVIICVIYCLFVILLSGSICNAQDVYYARVQFGQDSVGSYAFMVTHLEGDSLQIEYLSRFGKDKMVKVSLDEPLIPDSIGRKLRLRDDINQDIRQSLQKQLDADVTTDDSVQKPHEYQFTIRYKSGESTEYELTFTQLSGTEAALEFNKQQDTVDAETAAGLAGAIIHSAHSTLNVDSIMTYEMVTQLLKSTKGVRLVDRLIAALEGEESKAKAPLGDLKLQQNLDIPVGIVKYGPFLPWINIRKEFDSTSGTIGTFHAKMVRIAFDEGTLSDIVAEGTIELQLHEQGPVQKREISFHNLFPIPIGTASQIDEINDAGRYNLVGSDIDDDLNLDSDTTTDEITPYIDLSNLISYNREVIVGGNYIPGNKPITLTPEHGKKSVQLRKKSYADDFDIRLYTDISGLKKENPNGLIQTEARYHITLNTRYLYLQTIPFEALGIATLVVGGAMIASSPHFIYIPPGEKAGIGLLDFGLFTMLVGKSIPITQISPFVALSRIEDKNSLVGTATRPDTTISYTVIPFKTFDLLKYSNLMLGVELTAAKATFTGMSFNLKYLLGAGFYRTPIDSLSDDSSHASLLPKPVNLMSWYIMPEIVLQPIYSDRIEYDVRYGLMYSHLIDNTIDGNFNEIRQTISGDFIHKLQFNFNVFTDPDDRSSWVFLRSTMFINGSNSNLSLQIGYSTSISKLVGGK